MKVIFRILLLGFKKTWIYSRTFRERMSNDRPVYFSFLIQFYQQITINASA